MYFRMGKLVLCRVSYRSTMGKNLGCDKRLHVAEGLFPWDFRGVNIATGSSLVLLDCLYAPSPSISTEFCIAFVRLGTTWEVLARLRRVSLLKRTSMQPRMGSGSGLLDSSVPG